MSEAAPPLTGEPIAPRSGGCGKPALIGCAVLLLVAGIAAVIFVAKAKDFAAWSIEQARKGVEARLPDDATAAERERLAAAFRAAAERVRSGQFDPAALQRFQRRLLPFLGGADRKATREEIEGLIGALEELAGSAPPQPEEAPPAPAPAAPPA